MSPVEEMNRNNTNRPHGNKSSVERGPADNLSRTSLWRTNATTEPVLARRKPQIQKPAAKIVDTLKKAIAQLRPRIRRHGQKTNLCILRFTNDSKSFCTTQRPVRSITATIRRTVRSWGNKGFKLRINGRSTYVLDRLKPAYTLGPVATNTITTNNIYLYNITRACRTASPS